MAVDLESRRLGHFRLEVAPSVPLDWVEHCLARLDRLPPKGRRRVAFVPLPPGAPCSSAFLKVHVPETLRWKKPKRLLARLRPFRAIREGEALVALADAGIPVPRILFYGEEWRQGLRGRGVVATENLEAPTAWEVLQKDRSSPVPVRQCLAGLIRLHRLGHAHGDPSLHNVLYCGSGCDSFFIDLERHAPLDGRTCRRDLTRFLGSVYRVFPDRHLLGKLLALYAEGVGRVLPDAPEWFLANAEANRNRTSRWTRVREIADWS